MDHLWFSRVFVSHLAGFSPVKAAILRLLSFQVDSLNSASTLNGPHPSDYSRWVRRQSPATILQSHHNRIKSLIDASNHCGGVYLSCPVRAFLNTFPQASVWRQTLPLLSHWWVFALTVNPVWYCIFLTLTCLCLTPLLVLYSRSLHSMTTMLTVLMSSPYAVVTLSESCTKTMRAGGSAAWLTGWRDIFLPLM